jgi:hypothetical protein
MKFPKFDYLNLATTYLLFGLIYGTIVALVWNYLFEPISNVHLSILQGFGIHLITRILFGNTNTNYISNFYAKESFDLDKIDEKIKDIKEDLELEEERIEDEMNKDK